MRLAMRRLCAVAAVVLLAVTGCGGDDDNGSADSPTTGAGTPAETGPPETATPEAEATEDETDASPTDSATADDAVEIDVRIEDGSVRPAGERVDVTVGQTVRFVVDSDTADEIHVHSTPEHTFSFPAGADDRQFEFTIDQPGVVEAELHELGDVIVTLAARP